MMAFTGKATYSAGATLPEIAEDVSDLIGINSPHETPLLDALGDPGRTARSTVHEWLEDSLLPDADTFVSLPDAGDTSRLRVAHAERFRVGDQVFVPSTGELMLVEATDVPADEVRVRRGYGGSGESTTSGGAALRLLGNAALEGADTTAARFTARTRRVNYTQIFSATVEVSGTELAARQVGVDDELDYQKVQRTRELLRDLENSVINGSAATVDPHGGPTTRRTMNGLMSLIRSHQFTPGLDGFPAGTTLGEEQINLALREMWKSGDGQIDLMLVGGPEKRAINRFASGQRSFGAHTERYRDLVSYYESDFGVCRIVLSRHVPAGTVLLLDSRRIEVVPLSGRSFHFQRLARTGDREAGLVVGEYTLELRNENAHGVIRGLAA